MDTRIDAAPSCGSQDRLLATLERLLAIQTPEVTGALEHASTWIAQSMSADKADAFLHDPTIETLVAVGTSSTPLGRQQHRLGLDRLPLANGGRTVEVYRTGVSYHTGHAEEDPVVLPGVKGALGVRSMIAAPITIAGARRGVFALTSRQPDQFSEEDLRFCEAVGHWVGMVVQRAELAERVAQDLAVQARRAATEELASMLAHDLRTPLAPVRGYLELLRRDAQREGRSREVRYANQALLGVERLNRMIGDVLDSSRLEQGLFALELQPVDLVTLVQQTVAPLQAPDTTIRIAAPEQALVTQADPTRLRQAFENLIGNALRYSPRGAPVSVYVMTETQEDGDWAVVAVHDAGPGIPPSLVPRLCERFARGPQSSGLGLGLYLARGIAEAHGGTLSVEAESGLGTTFRLALPLQGD